MELAAILFGALLLDMIFGDPAVSWHPVALAGRLALRLENVFRRLVRNEFFAGMFCSLAVYAVFSIIAGFAVFICMKISPVSGIAAACVLVYFTIAPRSLCGHALAVEKCLRVGDVPGARRKISMIVSRDAEALDESGIVRSCVESLGENFSDGVTAAIFYVSLGWLVGGPVGAAAAAWLYRSSNTLDATFGYKNEKYIRFGTFPARFDDVMNFIPARLTIFAVALSAALLNLHPLKTLSCAWRDHSKHPSPNSAWGMASFAGALGVRLGGRTKYATGWKDYPYWGDMLEPLQLKHIRNARYLVLVSAPVFMLIMLGITLLIRRFFV